LRLIKGRLIEPDERLGVFNIVEDIELFLVVGPR
jgi:hypothetical protein